MSSAASAPRRPRPKRAEVGGGRVLDAPRDRSISYVRIRSPRGVWKTRAECAALIEKGEADFLLSGSGARHGVTDRKSTRLNSSHPSISYAVFCLKKKT